MKKIILCADEFVTDYIRGSQLNDAALINYLEKDLDYSIEKIHSLNLTKIDTSAFYIIGNFIGIPENIKHELSLVKNYIIYEKDFKFALVNGMPRHPLCWPNNIVPPDKIKWVDFYNGAQSVICLTQWHADLVSKNLPLANVKCINGTLWSKQELDTIDYIREHSIQKRENVIYNISYKNPIKAIDFCNLYNYKYTLLASNSNKTQFLESIAQHKTLVFLPDIPETCSRLCVESKMLGLHVITNIIVGATHEPWWVLKGQDLTNYFREDMIPKAIELFKNEITKRN